MWSARSEAVDLYLSGRLFAVRTGGQSVVHETPGGDWQSPLLQCLGEQQRPRVRVWLGGSQCSLHLVDPIAGVRSIEEAEAALGASLTVQGQPVEVRLATWSASSPLHWVAISTPLDLVSNLSRMVQERSGRLASLRPWWTAAQSQKRAKGESLSNAAMCDGEAISYWRTDAKGSMVAAGTLRVADAARQASLQRLRVAGPLPAWQLDLCAPQDGIGPGFAITSLDEAVDVAATSAV